MPLPITIEMQPLSLASSAEQLDIAPGAVSISMNAALLASSAPAFALTMGIIVAAISAIVAGKITATRSGQESKKTTIKELFHG